MVICVLKKKFVLYFLTNVEFFNQIEVALEVHFSSPWAEQPAGCCEGRRGQVQVTLAWHRKHWLLLRIIYNFGFILPHTWLDVGGFRTALLLLCVAPPHRLGLTLAPAGSSVRKRDVQFQIGWQLLKRRGKCCEKQGCLLSGWVKWGQMGISVKQKTFLRVI